MGRPGSRAQNSGSPWRSTIAARSESASQKLGGGRGERHLVEHAANATCRRGLWSVAMTRELSTILSSSGLLALGLLLLPR